MVREKSKKKLKTVQENKVKMSKEKSRQIMSWESVVKNKRDEKYEKC